MSALLLSVLLLGSPETEDPAPRASPSESATAQSAAPATEPVPLGDAQSTPEEDRRRAENEAVMRMAEGTSSEITPPANDSLPGLTGALLQMVIVLGAVCILAYLLVGKVLPRLMRVQMPTASRRILKVVDRVPIDQRGSILIVSVGDAYYLVGASQAGIHLLSRLEPDVVTAALEDPTGHTPKLSKWAEALLAKRQKES